MKSHNKITCISKQKNYSNQIKQKKRVHESQLINRTNNSNNSNNKSEDKNNNNNNDYNNNNNNGNDQNNQNNESNKKQIITTMIMTMAYS